MSTSPPAAGSRRCPRAMTNVRLWPEADTTSAQSEICSRGQTGHDVERTSCRHVTRSRRRSLRRRLVQFDSLFNAPERATEGRRDVGKQNAPGRSSREAVLRQTTHFEFTVRTGKSLYVYFCTKCVCPAANRTRLRRGQKPSDVYGDDAWRRFRQTPGGMPRYFLKARLNAGSDSYPTSVPACAMLAPGFSSIRLASCSRQRVRYCMGGTST